ncbi:TPA: dihydroorotate dehydrogenase, partial [Candidatus Micrarchaeota archaeon]|nr:dihydroorotate dehydrogenase [Candidatus Micrarchaeota archaeon]
MTGIATELFGKKMKNPLVLASGILGVSRKSLEHVADMGAGAVTTKSLSLEPRKGHETPIFIEAGCGALNAVGYSNPGIEHGLNELSGWDKDELLIISITGKDADEFGELAAKVEAQESLGAAAVEAVISCPHTPEYGLLAGQGTPESVAEIVSVVKKATKLPVIIKLSPSVPREVEQAKAAEKAGAAAINMGNSLGPGMLIDIDRKKPVLSFQRGGLSGPPIKPVAVRCVYDIYKAVKIPIIGTGGVTNGKDAIEMMMAGAQTVGVGTAVYYRGPEGFRQIADEMINWMEEREYRSVKQL